MLDNRTERIVANPPTDNVVPLDLSVTPPRVEAQNSVVRPPHSAVLTPDEPLGLVASAQKLDPASLLMKTPDNRLAVTDLRAAPSAVVQLFDFDGTWLETRPERLRCEGGLSALCAVEG